MIKVTKLINLEQLDKEINGKGLVADVDENKQVTSVGLAENNDATIEELKAAITAHKAVFKEASIEDKLASVGLSISDLKSALGI